MPGLCSSEVLWQVWYMWKNAVLEGEWAKALCLLVRLAKFGNDDKLMNQSCCQELLLVLSLDSKFENARRWDFLRVNEVRFFCWFLLVAIAATGFLNDRKMVEWMLCQCRARLGSLVFWTEIWKWPKVKCFVNESTWLNPGLMDAASKVSHDRRMVFLMCCAMLLCGLTANPANPIARSVRPFLVWVKFYGSFSVGCCDRILWNAKPIARSGLRECMHLVLLARLF
jgi:hypothetical protein